MESASTASSAAVRVAGVGTLPSLRRPPAGTATASLLNAALELALADAGVRASDVDGLGVASFSLAPDRAIDFAWHAGLRLRWIMDDVVSMNLVAHAVSALRAGEASVIAIVGGDALLGADYGALLDGYNATTRDHLAPLPAGGANPLFALVTQRHMAATGLTREDYGRVVVSQRAWAQTNPNAAYRVPLTIDEYLAAPEVAAPLTIFDCPPPVAAAEAAILTLGECGVRIRHVAASFNHDAQEGGLQTGLAELAPGLWRHSGIGPGELDVIELYDDYPVVVLMQLADLGIAAPAEAAPLLRGPGASGTAVNTSGGLLCAGQAGAAGGLHGFIEAVRQLRGERGAGQVPGARTALVTGYGMVLYRYGAAAVAAVLDSGEGG